MAMHLKTRSIRNMALQKNVENILEGHGYQWRSIQSDEHQTITSSGHLRRQMSLLGHVLRKEEMEHLVVTGFVDGKRTRGRQRIV